MKVDTLGGLAESDSVAYLKAKVKFGRYVTNFTVAKYLQTPEPFSFRVINENGKDVKEHLSQSTLMAIDSIAEIKIERERNNIYDSSGTSEFIIQIKKDYSIQLIAVEDKSATNKGFQKLRLKHNR